MWNPHLRVLAEDAVDRCRLCPHRQDAPPAARVGERRRSPQQRVERRDFKADKIAEDREDVRAPSDFLFAREATKWTRSEATSSG